MFITDILHKFLRVSDVLKKLFLNKLIETDKFQKKSIFDPIKHPNINKFSNFIKEKCKMQSIEKGSNLSKVEECLTGWMGPNKILLFRETSEPDFLSNLFNNVENISKVALLWSSYWKIDTLLRSGSGYTAKQLKKKTRKFLKLFLILYHRSKMTPYIHTMCLHLPEAYENFGNFFSAQGLEKLNDLSTYQYFSSTNKSIKNGTDNTFIKQMLEKDFRMATLGRVFE